MTVTKAIIPVAGWGTRRLPITKAIEKCMLPIANIPAIDFVVQDCLKAGITDFYFVVSETSSQLQTYYSKLDTLEAYLRDNGKEAMIASVTPPQANFHFVVQDSSLGKYGTTVPVWLCREYVQPGEQVLVIMGDQFFYRTDEGSNAAELVASVEASGLKNGLLGVPVLENEIPRYGIIEKDNAGNYVRIVEKPTIEDAPSNLNNASFYLFEQAVFDYFDNAMAHEQTGEYFIIDAINAFVADGNALKVDIAKGEYMDIGSVDGWLHANNVLMNAKSVM